MQRYLKINVYTNARREKVEKIDKDHLDIYVKEPAKENLANIRILEVIKFLYPGTKIKMINGHKKSRKLFSIEEK